MAFGGGGGMGMAALGGLASGYVEGQQEGMHEQMQALAIGEGKQKMEMTRMDIDRRKQLLEAQKSIAGKMQSMNTALATDPQGLATQLAQRSMVAADTYMDKGFPEEAMVQYKEGVTLLTNAAKMQEVLSAEQDRNSTMVANVADDVIGAYSKGGQQAGQRAQDKAMMTLRELHPNAKFQIQPGEPFDPQKWAMIKDHATDAKEKATIARDKATEVKDYAEAREHSAKAKKDEYDLQEEKKLETSIDKEGGDSGSVVGRVESGMIQAGSPFGQVVPGWGTAAVKERRLRVAQAAQDMKREHPDWSPERIGAELSKRQSTYAAERSGEMAKQRTVQTRAGAIESSINAMLVPGVGSIPLYEAAAQETDFSRLKPAKTGEQWYMDNVSDPKLTNYMLKANALAMEYAVVMARGGKGGTTDREHALDMIAKTKTPEQAMTVGNSLIQEARAQLLGTKKTLKGTTEEELTGEGSRNNPFTVTSDEDFTDIPPGSYFIDPAGQTRRKPGGEGR
jgi:hypothetical protein